jgi:SnoaL-like domain
MLCFGSTGLEASVIALSDVQGLLAHWWYAYDQGDLETVASLLADDISFQCESDTGETAYEDFIRCDRHGRDHVMEWQREHRIASPFPLRHNATNVHLVQEDSDAAEFASYLFVSQIANGGVSPLSSGLVHGTVGLEAGQLRFTSLRVTLDTMTSIPLGEHRAATAV